MKYQIIYFFILFIAINSVISEDLFCKEKKQTCYDSLECCSSYCFNQQCVEFGDDPYEKNLPNPCLNKVCSNEERCAIWRLPFYNPIDDGLKLIRILGPGQGFCVKKLPYEIKYYED